MLFFFTSELQYIHPFDTSPPKSFDLPVLLHRTAIKDKPPSFRLGLRYSAKAGDELIRNLSQNQRKVVTEIGFGAILSLPYYPKSFRKFYCWLLAKLDTQTMSLECASGQKIKVTPEDVHRILGLHNGSRPVQGVDYWEVSKAVIKLCTVMGFGESQNSMSVVGNEEIILNTQDCKSQYEICRFICAFTSLIVVKLLAPRNKQDPVQNDFYPAIANPTEVQQFNWCEYVVQEIRNASLKLKKSLFHGGITLNLFGCLIFLQVRQLSCLYSLVHTFRFLTPINWVYY